MVVIRVTITFVGKDVDECLDQVRVLARVLRAAMERGELTYVPEMSP